jgi:hypothetical protein
VIAPPAAIEERNRMAQLPIIRVVLYKHGVGYFEREGTVAGDETVSLAFKQAEVSDVLKSLTVLDLDGGHVAAVSYDSTKPLQELLAEVALSIPEENGLAGLLPQLKGARVRVRQTAAEATEGMILGLDSVQHRSADGIVEEAVLSLLADDGTIRSVALRELSGIQLLDAAVQRDLDYYLKSQLSAKKKDARSFSILARGEGDRRLRLAYTVAAPVWKATYRLILGEEAHPPMIQGWAVVDNTQDEDWENVELCLVSGLPVSFRHDLYTPRYIVRPIVEVKETTGVLPPELEEGIMMADLELAPAPPLLASEAGVRRSRSAAPASLEGRGGRGGYGAAPPISSMPAQVRERKLGDLFAYEIEHPVTIRRNQAALVPIVLREFKGRPVLLYNKNTRAGNPMRCVEFENSTGLTLEGGPVTVLEGGSYVGEAMLETIKPDETRLVPFAVELGVKVLDNVASENEHVSRVVIAKGTMQTHHGQIQKTTYVFDNKGDAPALVYLEHPRAGDDWKLVEPAKAHEVTESYWRFRFDLAAKGTTRFVVRTQRLLSQRFALADTPDRQLELWIDQKYLDADTEKVIRQSLALRHQAADAQERIRQLEAERKAIHAEQDRIRQNLKSLGDRSSEKELRERFVRTLGTQEDRLEAIEREIADQTREANRIRQQVADLLYRLSYKADLQGSAPGDTKTKKRAEEAEEPEEPS